MKSSKRLDLQGIRGFAIIVVLGFHFFPDYCPNGYLGVDQFFVLSGFLMCMLLKRAEDQSTFSLISLFYSKRFKRILPLYFVIIFFSMLALYCFFPDTAIETNQESAIRAVLFVSNRGSTVQENYFQKMLIAVDIFTHTWSLSVEVQFYFLVPFIFIIANRTENISFQYLYYGIIGVASYIVFITSSPTIAFNSVFARIWQFLIGMIVFLLGTPLVNQDYQVLRDAEEGELECRQSLLEEQVIPPNNRRVDLNSFKITAYVLITCMAFITLCPIELPASLVRPLITIGTGVLMLCSDENMLLSNRVLTYIGDISYSLYLIHWGFYAHWKLTGEGSANLLLLALVSSVILAVITFELFEKWYLTLSSTNIGIMVVALLFLNVVVINKNEITDMMDSNGRNFSSLDHLTDNMTLDDAEKLNYQWIVNDNKNLYSPSCVYESVGTPLGWCRHTGLSENRKYKFALIGNSWVANHATMFYQECAHKAKSILQGSAYGCEPLYPSDNDETCKANFTDFEQHIEKEKPDYAFIFTRFEDIGTPFPKNVKSFDVDHIYQTMKTQMLKLIRSIKYKLYILDALPRIVRANIRKIVPWLRNHTEPIEIDKKLEILSEYDMARKRHAQLMKDCRGKCEMIDYVPDFFNETTKTFRFYDERGFSYFTSALHLTPHGVERVRHHYTDLCAKL